MGRRRFDVKPQKTAKVVGNDRLFLLDSEDTATVIIDGSPVQVPKVKTKKVSEFSFGGGGDQVVARHIVIVEPAAYVVTGKFYKTYAAALAYIKTQTHSAADPWVILLPSGTFSENIEFNSDISVYGNSTVLTGTVTSMIKFWPGISDLMDNTTYIRGCTLKSIDLSNDKRITQAHEWRVDVTYGTGDEISRPETPGIEGVSHFFRSLTEGNIGNDPNTDPGTNWENIDSEVGLPMLYTDRCFIDLTAAVPGTVLPGAIVANDCNFMSGDLSGNFIVYAFKSLIYGGSYPAYSEMFSTDSFKTEHCTIYGGTLNGGNLLDTLVSEETSEGLTVNKGVYTFQGGGVRDITIPVDSTSTEFINCVMDTLALEYGSTSASPQLYIRNCPMKSVTVTYPESETFSGGIIVGDSSGSLTIKDTIYANLTRKYTGPLYDNRSKVLTAEETQAAIDELSAANRSPFLLGERDDPQTRMTGIYAKAIADNLDINFDFDPFKGGGGVNVQLFGRQGVNLFGYGSAVFDRCLNMGNLNVSGREMIIGVVTAIDSILSRVTLLIPGDYTSLEPDQFLLFIPVSGTTRMKKIISVSALIHPDPMDPQKDYTNVVVEDNEDSFLVLQEAKQFVFYDTDGAIATDSKGLYRTTGKRSVANGDMSSVSGEWSETAGRHAAASGTGCEAQGFGSVAKGMACFSGLGVVFSSSYVLSTALRLNGETGFGLSLGYGKPLKITALGIKDGVVAAYSTYAANMLDGYETAKYVLLRFADSDDMFKTSVEEFDSVIGFFAVRCTAVEKDDPVEGFMFTEGIGNISGALLSSAKGLLSITRGVLSRAEGDACSTGEEAHASVAEGIHARADYAGSKVLGAGSEVYIGDRQSFEVNLKGISTVEDTYGVPLMIDYTFFGEREQKELVMPEYTVWRFSIEALALSNDGKSFGQTITGLCKSDKYGNSTLLDITYAEAHKSEEGFDAEVIVECAAEGGFLRIKGRTGGDVDGNWLANVRIVQISRVPV